MFNEIHSFKGRQIDLSKPVSVYRNLTRKGRVYSIKQGSLVVAYAYRLLLSDAKFTVNKKAQAKIRITKQRQVHAYAKGHIIPSACETEGRVCHYVTYNPYKNDNFVMMDEMGDFYYIETADCLEFNERGLYVYL